MKTKSTIWRKYKIDYIICHIFFFFTVVSVVDIFVSHWMATQLRPITQNEFAMVGF